MLKLLANILLWPFTKRRQMAQNKLDAINAEKWRAEANEARKGDLQDYDGMGDWGRFPPIKK